MFCRVLYYSPWHLPLSALRGSCENPSSCCQWYLGDMITSMCREITFEEIKNVLLTMKANKAPWEPDGYSAGFLRRLGLLGVVVLV